MKEKIGYVTTSEAANVVKKYSVRQINKICEASTSNIRYYIDKKSNRRYVHLNDTIQYCAAHPKIETTPVWGHINIEKGECFYPIFGYDNKYFISNRGRIINATDGNVLTIQLHRDVNGKPDGYRYVTLMLYGTPVVTYLHHLVAMTQCPNNRRCSEIHHDIIVKNGVVKNENPKHLTYVAPDEHTMLHRLYNKGDMDGYNKLLFQIKKKNKEKLYPIYDEQDMLTYFVSKKGYEIFKKTKDFPVSEIRFCTN